MKQTIALKLHPSDEQRQQLLDTMTAFNAAVQLVADIAFAQHTANKITLHHLLYYRLREEFHLSSQMAVRAIGKATESYKRDKSIHCTFDPLGAMVYDERILNFRLTEVSILTLSGREMIPFRFGAYQAGRLDRIKGQADLIYRGGEFYLYVTVEMPEADPVETTGFLGVDLGIVEIATDSEGNSYSGEPVKTVRKRVKRQRALLQSAGTKSAKKHLQRIAKKQSRFVRNTNHCISKTIVQTACASAKAIVLENLEGIRERVSGYGREMRWLMGNWAFDQLRQFITYKAAMAGLPVILIDPRNTSRECAACGYIDKANRKSQAHFCCLQCGHDDNADKNAAKVISARGALSAALLLQAPSGLATSPSL